MTQGFDKHAVNRYVGQFLRRLKQAETVELKLRMLCEAANVKFEIPGKLQRAQMRRKFNKRTKVRGAFRENKSCQVCAGPAQVRHHIVALKNGGHNHRKNQLVICRNCHAQIHPWLRTESAG